MSNFTWNPNEDQNYIEAYGSSAVNGVDFGKRPGKSFTMNAPDEVLTLQYSNANPTKKSQSDDETFVNWIWGAYGGLYDEALPDTKINIRAGELVIDGLNNKADDSYSALAIDNTDTPPTIVTIGPSGKLTLKNICTLTGNNLTSETNTKIDITGDGELSFTVDSNVVKLKKMSFVDLTCPIHVKDDSKLKIDAHQIFAYSSIALSHGSDMQLTASKISLNNFSFIKVSDNATCTLLIDDSIKIANSGCFILNTGEASINIPASPTTNLSVFDFMPATTQLPKGIFDFLDDGRGNQSTLSLSVLNAFQMAALKEGGFIAINGEPQNLNDLIAKFNITVKGRDIHFQLK